ncbi:phenylalanine--tRNA ligase subunit beta [Candidatus Woesebacteria bacterium]|nr:phenylalanine--tRNA ligase subunit beta [Candidatus Woesebacteria bacterium]
MDILIPDEWLRRYLKTNATPTQIMEFLSLCGPSVEKITESINGPVYAIEVTTNRVDAASVYGIAREAAVILPRFKINAKLNPIKLLKVNYRKSVNYLNVKNDLKLCYRFTAVLIKGVKVKDSPNWLKKRLISTGVRPINNVIDISNYVMHEMGQPVHTFDYDKIAGSKMTLRESRKGETITTLDGKSYNLTGGDIVIEDGRGSLIDLAGIMGGSLSKADENTKNVLLFVQTYNPTKIRKTSMELAVRTEAAVLFEKGLDPELVDLGVTQGIKLFEKLCGGVPSKEVLDIYPNPRDSKKITLTLDKINQKVGINVSKFEIESILKSLGFKTNWKLNNLTASVPSYRRSDISIPEDIIEEIARIYGYFNLPSKLMEGGLPQKPTDSPFGFEDDVKNLLKAFGGAEIYTLSLVSKKATDQNSLKLRNPLGPESEYLRQSLKPSLINAANSNVGNVDKFHLFEMANVYIPRKNDLPEEKMMLGGILASYEYREGKGIIEALLDQLNIFSQEQVVDSKDFSPSKRLVIKSGGLKLGEIGILENGHIYYEFDTGLLQKQSSSISSYKPLPKYPPQIEDLTFILPEKTKVGELIKAVLSNEKLVSELSLKYIYVDAFTFRVSYQDINKTLTNVEAEKIRNRVVSLLQKKFGATLKG